MDVQKLTHEVRLQQWSAIVNECRSSGSSIKSWCEENGINIKTYYYWQKKVCQATCRELAMGQQQNLETFPTSTPPVFAELSMPRNQLGNVALTIHHHNTEVHIYSGADPALVETALVALRSLC